MRYAHNRIAIESEGAKGANCEFKCALKGRKFNERASSRLLSDECARTNCATKDAKHATTQHTTHLEDMRKVLVCGPGRTEGRAPHEAPIKITANANSMQQHFHGAPRRT